MIFRILIVFWKNIAVIFTAAWIKSRFLGVFQLSGVTFNFNFLPNQRCINILLLNLGLLLSQVSSTRCENTDGNLGD